MFQMQDYYPRKEVVTRMVISEKNTLNGMENDNNGRLMRWLIYENITVKTNNWKSEDFGEIGWFARHHPTVMWKNIKDRNEYFRTTEYNGQEKQEWFSRNGRVETGQEGVESKEFVLLHDRKSYGKGNVRT